MALVKALMRYFGYFYHGLLALFLLVVSGMALATGMHSLRLSMLPWKGESLTWWTLGLALLGLASVVLAVKRILPAVFFVWTIVVLAFMLKGYVFSGYYFRKGEIATTGYLIAGAVISALGAWYGMKGAREQSRI